MRIPFPERVPLSGAAVFAAVLFLAQQMAGTALYFSAGSVLFIMIAAFGFNIGGGLTRTAGAYIFFYSLLVVIVGVSYKAYLGEPGESNLLAPKTDLLVYLGGISGMTIAAFLSRKLSRRSPLLKNVLPVRAMYRASVGCIVFGSVGGFLIALLGEAGVRLISAFTQLNFLVPLGMILGVTYEIHESGGKRSVNLPILLGGAFSFYIFGLVNFSKQAMFTPLLCWLLPVCAYRYRLTLFQVLSMCGSVVVLFYFLWPYAQYGKSFLRPNQTLGERIEISTRLLMDPADVRRNEIHNPGLPGYYNTAQGFWDRLQFVSVDDHLVKVTDDGKKFGYSPLLLVAMNAIPHIIWPNKPNFSIGNTYAHEAGTLNAENLGTGISFSPTAEAYHLDGWISLLLVAPMLWFMLFLVYDLVLGDLRATPWGLLTLALLSHVAPEGMLNGTIYLVTFGLEITVFCAYFAAWIAPYLAVLALGPVRLREPQFLTPPSPIRKPSPLDTPS